MELRGGPAIGLGVGSHWQPCAQSWLLAPICRDRDRDPDKGEGMRQGADEEEDDQQSPRCRQVSITRASIPIYCRQATLPHV